MTCDVLASRPEGVEILLAASCFRNHSTLRFHAKVHLLARFLGPTVWLTLVEQQGSWVPTLSRVFEITLQMVSLPSSSGE